MRRCNTLRTIFQTIFLEISSSGHLRQQTQKERPFYFMHDFQEIGYLSGVSLG